ncbi:MaoC/PaaZ C-terminal domain-containing protein [Mycolicibacterium sp.]|uniref:MaoC/PaaZ C-terminal domain-containing protein n=1 Tax=Mycolicibacterium sp. TaxID=2320850 RepID=UPI003D14C394
MTDTRLRAEDLPVGRVLVVGDYTVSRAEIVAFARQWDPQPVHLDEEFARGTRFGDLIGSGLHTLAIFQRLCALNVYRDWAVIAGRTIRDVQLLRPLRPDSTVRVSLRIDAVTPDSPARALVRKTGTVCHGDTVLMTIDVESYVERRPDERLDSEGWT